MNEFKTREATHSKKFGTLQLRTKIVLGILLTGGVVLGVLALFAYNRAQQITELLSNRLEKSVDQQAEEQLASVLAALAEQINNEFSDTANDIMNLANYRVALEEQSANLSLGTYWDAHTKLFRLPGGQYGNSTSDTASVFIPSTVLVNEDLLANLNTTAYLDFSAPTILKAHDTVTAIYHIDTTGTTTYYPNTNYASIVPPDFDATSQIFFKIATPSFDPQRTPRWTFPYQDPTGTGLVVTVSAPVYVLDQFKGVIAADLKLDRISAEVEKITVGQTGYAFLIDDTGHIITMPPAGYTLYNIQPEKLEKNEIPKQIVIGKGSFELRSITKRIVAGGTGLLSAQINGVDTYIAFTRIDATKYGLALVVPVAEMNTEVLAARAETQKAVRSTLQLGALVLIGLFGVAFIASIGLSQIIVSPVIQLTRTTEQITAGDLSAKAVIETDDEIGRLANAFNIMTGRLRDAVTDLEQQAIERTTELALANQSIQKRSSELQVITEISQTIALTQNIDDLLPLIASLISERFGFYHVGIFMLDEARENAVLQAANSKGGQRMLARKHKLKLGSTSIVGFASQTGRPRVALDVGADISYFDNPDLPDTHSEVALPLKISEQVIGVLDVQSTETAAFKEDELGVLTILANQVAVAIQNARLYRQTQTALSEARRTVSRRLAPTSQASTGFIYAPDGTIQPAPALSVDQTSTNASNQTIVLDAASGASTPTLHVPVKLRDQIVGFINIESSDPNRNWSEDEIALVEAISERAAFALENARLFENVARRADQEETVARITSSISASTDFNRILQTTIQELSQAIGTTRAFIQLETPSPVRDNAQERM